MTQYIYDDLSITGRINVRTVILADNPNININSDLIDIAILTSLSQASTFNNPTGSPTEGQLLQIRITSTISRAITFGSAYQGTSSQNLPTSTTGGNKEDYIAFRYNTLDSEWDLIGTTIGSVVISNQRSRVVLQSNAINNNAVANTLADVSGLSFSVVANSMYYFEFNIIYNAAATTTGSRWSVNVPASPTNLSYNSQYSLTTTTNTFGNYNANDLPAASNVTSANTTGNIAIIKGFVRPSSNGIVIARFASEVASSAITALAGSFVEYMVVI